MGNLPPAPSGGQTIKIGKFSTRIQACTNQVGNVNDWLLKKSEKQLEREARLNQIRTNEGLEALEQGATDNSNVRLETYPMSYNTAFINEHIKMMKYATDHIHAKLKKRLK
jgi:hypothetical protein